MKMIIIEYVEISTQTRKILGSYASVRRKIAVSRLVGRYRIVLRHSLVDWTWYWYRQHNERASIARYGVCDLSAVSCFSLCCWLAESREAILFVAIDSDAAYVFRVRLHTNRIPILQCVWH